MVISEIKASKQRFKGYLIWMQELGYSKAEIIQAILRDSKEVGEDVTYDTIKGLIYRANKELNLKFADGNKKRINKGSSKVVPTEESTSTVVQDSDTKVVPIEESMPKVVQNSDTKVVQSNNTKVVPIKQEENVLIDKLDKILSLLENKDVIEQSREAFKMKISSSQEEIQQATIKVNKESWEKFNNFCKDANFKQYKKQDLLSQAIIEFIEKYS